MKYRPKQRVNIYAMGSFGDDGVGTVKEIVVYYHKHTGKSYRVVVLKDGQEFDYEKGHALTPPIAYYITPKED